MASKISGIFRLIESLEKRGKFYEVDRQIRHNIKCMRKKSQMQDDPFENLLNRFHGDVSEKFPDWDLDNPLHGPDEISGTYELDSEKLRSELSHLLEDSEDLWDHEEGSLRPDVDSRYDEILSKLIEKIDPHAISDFREMSPRHMREEFGPEVDRDIDESMIRRHLEE